MRTRSSGPREGARRDDRSGAAGVLFLALVFLAELGAWAAIGFATFQLAHGGVPGAVAAVLCVAVAIAAWGLWASPRSSAPRALSLAVKVVVFGGAVGALLTAGHPRAAVVLGLLVVVSHTGVALTRAG